MWRMRRKTRGTQIRKTVAIMLVRRDCSTKGLTSHLGVGSIANPYGQLCEKGFKIIDASNENLKINILGDVLL